MPVTTPPAVDTLPPAPVRGQAGFSAATGLFLEALPDFGEQVDASGQATAANAAYVEELAAEIEGVSLVAADAAGLVAQSTSTLTVGAGTKSIHFSSAKPLLAELNRRVAIVLKSDGSVRMFGTITTVTDSDDVVVTVVSNGVFGSGTYSSWQIIDAAFFAAGASAEDIWAGTTDAAAVTPLALKAANERVALDYASTVTPDLSEGWNRSLTASASFTMGAPINCSPGDVLKVDIVNSASSVVLAVNAAWKRQGGLGIIGPNNADESRFIGFVEEVNGSGVMTKGTYNIIRTPS